MRRFATSTLTTLLQVPWWMLLTVPVVASVALVSTGEPQLGVTIVFLTIAGIGLLSLIAKLAGIDVQSREIAIEMTLGDDASDMKQALFERWLRRSRHYRYVGGTIGLILGVGFANNGGLTEALFGLFGGIAAGGALAELHVLQRRKAGPRAADLSTRQLNDYTSRSDSITMAAITIVSLATGAAALLTTQAPGSRSLVLAGTSIAIVALTVGLQSIVTTRPRPAVDDELRKADDLLRHLAATQGFARPAIAVALMSLAFAVGDLGSDPLLGLAAFAIGLAGIVWYVRSRQTAVVDISRRSSLAAA